jgi:preprotein translocase SecF subunit
MRFKFAFAAGTVVALLHDAIAILACFLFLDKDISLNMIGAILTVLGYSINDTVVIFTRIRNNLKHSSGQSMHDVVNMSINQTLRRTLLTSFATTLVVASLFIFGGEVLRDLSLALLVGIIVGTYSSIYIASPVMMMLNKAK